MKTPSTEFQTALRENGHSYKYFIDTYLPDINLRYAAIHKQITGYTAISEPVENAIKQYIKDYYGK